MKSPLLPSPRTQVVMGIVLLGAWLVILTYDPVGKGRNIGIAGFVVTLIATGVLLRGFVASREPGTAMVVLSMLVLVLGIFAMIALTF